MVRIALASIVPLVALAGTADAQPSPPAPSASPAPFTETTLQSAVLSESRRIIVRLPRHYERDAGQRFAVLYKLDGTNGLTRYDETIDVLHRRDLMPDAIVVAIPNASGMRNRDLTPPTLHQDGGEDGAIGTGEMGRGDRFLEFIRAELIPHIDKTYRTTGERLLIGHSRGALLVMHSLISDPDLFSGRFLFSAPLTRDGARLFDEVRAVLGARSSLRTFLYFNWGGAENEGMQRSSDRMVALLEERSPPGLRWVAERAAGADHQAMATAALPAALTTYFAKPR